MPIFLLTGGFIVLFCALALVNLDTLSALVDAGFSRWSARFFGLYWQLLLLATFFIGLLLCVFARRQGEAGRAGATRVRCIPVGIDDHVHPARRRWRVLGGG